MPYLAVGERRAPRVPVQVVSRVAQEEQWASSEAPIHNKENEETPEDVLDAGLASLSLSAGINVQKRGARKPQKDVRPLSTINQANQLDNRASARSRISTHSVHSDYSQSSAGPRPPTRSVRLSAASLQPQTGPLGSRRSSARLSSAGSGSQTAASPTLSPALGSRSPTSPGQALMSSMGVYIDPASATPAASPSSPVSVGPTLVRRLSASRSYRALSARTVSESAAPPTPPQSAPHDAATPSLPATSSSHVHGLGVSLGPGSGFGSGLGSGSGSGLGRQLSRRVSSATISGSTPSRPSAGSQDSGASIQRVTTRRSFLGLRRDPRDTRDARDPRDGSRDQTSRMSGFRRSIASLSSSNSLFRLANEKEPPAKVNRNMISLPTPSESTRDRLQNKLKASPSLLSLTPTLDSSFTEGVPDEAFQQQKQGELLSYCSDKNVLDMHTLDQRLGRFTKFAEAPQCELYTSNAVVYKVIPFGGLNQPVAHELIQEMAIGKAVTGLDGFVHVVAAYVAQGPYCPSMVEAWDAYAGEHVTRNKRPASYDAGQLYFVQAMENAGTPLPDFEMQSTFDAVVIFWQIAKQLAKAERLCQFEHRDLHVGNLLVQRTPAGPKATMIDLMLARVTPDDNPERPLYTRLDHPKFFADKGGLQHEIHRCTQRLLLERSVDKQEPEWGAFEPRTNVLWLYYLVRQLNEHLDKTAKFRGDRERRRLGQIEQELNPSKRRLFKHIRSAIDVVAWGVKHRMLE